MQRILIPVAVAAAVAVVPAGAAAATAGTQVPCYLNGQTAPISAAGSGFTPAAPVAFTGSGFTGSGVADAAGNAAAQFPAPRIDPKRRSSKTFPFTATDGTQTAAGSFKVVNGGAIWSDQGRIRTVVKWTFGGLPPGKRIYVHVRRNGKTLKTTAAGRAGGVCGRATKRLRRLPIRGRAGDGTYQIAIDVSRRYRASTAIYRYKYVVRTRPRF